MELIPISIDGKRQEILLIVGCILKNPPPLVPADSDAPGYSLRGLRGMKQQ